VKFKLVGLLAFLFLCSSASNAQEITVAAAADLQSVMQEITARFQKETGKTVKVIDGSSGNFFQQIPNGGPFDIFFSANLDYPKKLETAGLTEPGSFYQQATGKIVLWLLNDSKLDINSGLKVLLDPSIKKVAIANRQRAPYGFQWEDGRMIESTLRKCILEEQWVWILLVNFV